MMKMELKDQSFVPGIHSKLSLSVHQISIEYGNLANAGVLAQQSALVLISQIPIDSFFAESGADAIPLAATQGSFKLNAKYYLDGPQAYWIKLISAATTTCNVISAVSDQLHQPMDVSQLRQILLDSFDAITSEMDDTTNQAAINRAVFPNFTKKIGEAYTIFAKEIDKRIADLSGSGGSIAVTKKKIEALKEDLSLQLRNILSSADDIGDVINKMITNVVTTFMAGKTTANKQRSNIQIKSENGLPISGTDFKSGINGLADASKKYREDIIVLGELYQQLHSEEEMLAIAIAIEGQTKAFVEDIRNMELASIGLADKWKDADANYNSIYTELNKGEISATRLSEIKDSFLHEADNSWAALKLQLQKLSRALSGLGN